MKSIPIKIKKNLSRQIAELRTEKGWSKSEMARELETSVQQISRLEDPEHCTPTISSLLRVAKIFNKELIIKFKPKGVRK